MRFLIRWLVTSIAVAAAVALVPGISVSGEAWSAVIFTALILGLLNATLGLLLRIGTIGCMILTLGLFNLVVNAWLLSAASSVAQNWFGLGFEVDGFWPAFWGGVIISVVSSILNWFARPSDDRAYSERG